MNLRLRHRYSLVIVTLLLSAVVMIAGAAVVTISGLSERTQASSARLMTSALSEQAIADGRDLVALVAQIAATSLSNADMKDLEEDLQTVRRYRGVQAIRVMGASGRLLRDSRTALPEERRQKSDAAMREVLDKRVILHEVNGDILSVAAPILADEQMMGAIYVDISLASFMPHISSLRQEVARMSEEAQRSLVGMIGLAALILAAVGLLVGLLVARSLSHPIKSLSAATRRIGLGEEPDDLPTDRSDEIGDLARDLSKMAKGLRQADRMVRLATVGEVAVGVAHELNQPLNTIRMASDNALAALEESLPDMSYLRSKLALVSQLAGNMGEQIQRMCAVGRRDERRIAFDPLPSVRDALALHSGGLDAQGIEMIVTWPGDKPAFVQGLPNQFMQVLVNLIANARDAIVDRSNTPLGRVRSVRGWIRLTMAIDEIAREFRMDMADNGGGIPPEIIGRIFDPFFTTKEVNKGTGLGLSIGYGIVAGMGGYISVKNAPDGAVFTVVLPLVSGADIQAAE